MFNQDDFRVMKSLGNLIITNPFSAERQELEQKILGKSHTRLYQYWHNIDGELTVNTNLDSIATLCNHLIQKGLSIWEQNFQVQSNGFMKHWDLMALYWLFSKYSSTMSSCLYDPVHGEDTLGRIYNDFAEDYARVLIRIPRHTLTVYDPDIVFALCHQVHRAFNNIFNFIAGGSRAAADMRASIWQSIFTCDLGRYYRHLYSRMRNLTTLITGESGTGKELVARAIARSQFIPFDSKNRQFTHTYLKCFHPVQLSAMPQTMIESELFGHCKGAFTGAVAEHHGYFESCQPCGCIFLDEIGDISAEIQVKLLRVLQNRTFQRIGDVTPITFQGKIIAATNVDLFNACQCGNFRKDLLFRLCADNIQTAPLRILIDGQEEELRQFVIILSKRLLDGPEAMRFANRCCRWIKHNLGINYPWPGNVRELEQCLRNLLIRGSYTPIGQPTAPSPAHSASSIIRQLLEQHPMNAENLMKNYLQVLYQNEGSYLKVAAKAQLDRRTVKKYLDLPENTSVQ